MASDQHFPGMRRRMVEQAANAVHALACADSSDAQLAVARDNLRRAVALGQVTADASHPALEAALAAIAAASRAQFGDAVTAQQLAAALGMYGNLAVELGHSGARPLAVALCAILQVWSGRDCHVIGASDYLAARDATALAGLYARCGCSVAALAADTPEPALASRYASDVLYATGRQLLSDSLRDQMLAGDAAGPLRRRMQAQRGAGDSQPMRRSAAVAIIDDIEGVLVDEAGSPVLISAAGNLAVMHAATEAARVLVAALAPERDYVLVREPAWRVHLTEAGMARVQQQLHMLPVYWQHPQRRDDVVGAALLARDVLEPERHYQVREGRVLIADDSVFRLLGGRVWHFGMLQAVEAREGVPLSMPPRTVARAALQSFFPRYRLLSGAGASFDGLARELRRCYGLRVLSLRPRAAVPIAQRYGFASAQAKLDAFAELVAQCQHDGVAVLASAPRTADLAAIGRRLKERELAFHVADGRDPQLDAATLAGAGEPGKITLTTGAALRNGELAPAGSRPLAHALLFEHWDSARADQAFFAWGAHAVVFGGAGDDLLVRALPHWAGWLRTLAPAPMRLMVRLAQWHGGRSGSRYRQSLALRENQLDEQLAFSTLG